MKETGIIMSGNHPELILDGIKTQTRRVIKPQPTRHWSIPPARFYQGYFCEGGCKIDENSIKCPYGQVGDRLWVRETWRLEMHSGCFDVAYKDTVWKKDAGSNPYMTQYAHLRDRTWVWRPSIFMPRWASRITLEITEVRVERLQEISGLDCIREGLLGEEYQTAQQVIEEYAQLWGSLNAKRGFGWEVNPWVWVISFKEV